MARDRGLGAQAAKERDLHQQQLRGYGFLAGRGPRRSATVVPAPLRYWQYDPPRPVPIARGGWASSRPGSACTRGTAAGPRWPTRRPSRSAWEPVVLAANIGRFTVSDHGLSADVPATRTNPAAIVPLALVREVVIGAPPASWPTAARRGGWLPGRTRVAVRHLADDGTERAFTRWVRDPAAFAEALDQPSRR